MIPILGRSDNNKQDPIIQNWPSTVLHPLIGVVYQHVNYPDVTGHVTKVQAYFDVLINSNIKIYTSEGKVYDVEHLRFAWVDDDNDPDTLYLNYDSWLRHNIYWRKK